MGYPVIAAALLACAANIAPATLNAVVAVESRGDPLAILDNTTRRSWHPHDQAAAIALAQRLVAAGHRVDLSLMQVDSANLPALGLSIAQAFDPCTNIRAGGTILTADYAQARQRWGDGQIALQHALVAYNSGRFWGDRAYLARYYGREAVLAVSVRVQFSALKRGREKGHGSEPHPRRPRWNAAQLARLSAPTTVYSRVSLNIPIN